MFVRIAVKLKSLYFPIKKKKTKFFFVVAVKFHKKTSKKFAIDTVRDKLKFLKNNRKHELIFQNNEIAHDNDAKFNLTIDA